MGQYTRITGTVEYTGDYSAPGTATVGGLSPVSTTTQFTPIVMPDATDLTGFTEHLGDQGPGTIEPNSLSNAYGTLATTAQNQLISLKSGTYYFEEIAVSDGGLTLQIDLSSGNPVEIYVLGNAVFSGQNYTLEVKGAGTNGLFVPIDQAQWLASLIYLEAQKFVMGGSNEGVNLWGGTVYASSRSEESADITIGQYIDWYGAAYAFDDFYAADHGTWNYVPLGAPIREPATMLLLGSGLIGLAGIGRKKFFKK